MCPFKLADTVAAASAAATATVPVGRSTVQSNPMDHQRDWQSLPQAAIVHDTVAATVASAQLNQSDESQISSQRISKFFALLEKSKAIKFCLHLYVDNNLQLDGFNYRKWRCIDATQSSELVAWTLNTSQPANKPNGRQIFGTVGPWTWIKEKLFGR